jgi:hypothetical protein
MATMGFRPYPGPDANKIAWLPEVVSATFKTGDLVILSAGFVTIATVDEDIYGIALKDYTGTTSTPIPVYVLSGGEKLIAEATATTTEVMKGVGYELTMTAGSMGVATSTTSSPTFMVEQLDPRDGATTGAGGRVIGHIYDSSIDGIGG